MQPARPFFKKQIDRRTFFKHGLRLSALGLLAFMFTRRDNLVVETVPIAFPNLPPAFNNFRIVQISDLHASFWVGEDYLMRVVDRVNQLEKDLVVVTGDIITGAVNDFWKKWLPVSSCDYTAMVARVLGNLKTGHKLAVLGNHDQWDGLDTEKRLVAELENVGIRFLRNSALQVARGSDTLHIAGIDDVWFSHDLDRAIKKIPLEEFKIFSPTARISCPL